MKRLGPRLPDGLRLDGNGYAQRYAPDHPWLRKGTIYVYEHIRLMELDIGRRIAKSEVVHHIDGDITNNALENLELLERGEHTRRHHEAKRQGRICPQGHLVEGENVVRRRRSADGYERFGCRLCSRLKSRVSHGYELRPEDHVADEQWKRRAEESINRKDRK